MATHTDLRRYRPSYDTVKPSNHCYCILLSRARDSKLRRLSIHLQRFPETSSLESCSLYILLQQVSEACCVNAGCLDIFLQQVPEACGVNADTLCIFLQQVSKATSIEAGSLYILLCRVRMDICERSNFMSDIIKYNP
jgi:hypothetical protein